MKIAIPQSPIKEIIKLNINPGRIGSTALESRFLITGTLRFVGFELSHEKLEFRSRSSKAKTTFLTLIVHLKNFKFGRIKEPI